MGYRLNRLDDHFPIVVSKPLLTELQFVRYRLNRHDELVFMAGPKLMLTEFGIHYTLESCGE